MTKAYPYDHQDDLYVPDTLFDEALHDILHMIMDRLLAAGSSVEAHADVLGDDMEDQPDPAQSLLAAQLGVKGGEDELQLLSSLLQTLSQLLIIRQSRSIILDKSPVESLAN